MNETKMMEMAARQSSRDKAEAIARGWFRRHLDGDVGVGTIEWR